MKVTRRDLLVWSAGAAAGLMVTPVPWKLLDDTSIWSQNWPWIPQPVRGPIEAKPSFCTLCPQGCGMKVRMAGGWPVGVAGVASHPISRGTLCPLGFGAHQLNWHPQRLRTVRHRGTASSWDEARKAFTRACGDGPVMVIDGYPGRAASQVLEAFAQKRGGAFRVVLGTDARSLAPYETWNSAAPASGLGYDFENTRTIVSFGAPLLDGWGAPGRLTRLWSERAAGMMDPQLRLIQVESSLSRTAARAWQWVPIRAGAEAALAAGLARVLLEEHLVPAHGPMPPLSVAAAADLSGLTPDAIRDLARTIVAQPPVVVIPNGENPAVAALNVVLDSVGQRGGIVRRSKAAKSQVSAGAVPSNICAVLIDASVPWDFHPATDAEVYRFAAWDGGSTRADWLLPAPGFLEELTDVPSAPTSAVETYAVAPALIKPGTEVQSAAQFLYGLDKTLTPVETIIHSRCENLFRARAGTLHGQELTPVATVPSIEKFEEQLRSGAVFVGELPHPASIRCELKEWPPGEPVQGREDWSTGWTAPVLPPLSSKLCQESNLRESPDRRSA